MNSSHEFLHCCSRMNHATPSHEFILVWWVSRRMNSSHEKYCTLVFSFMQWNSCDEFMRCWKHVTKSMWRNTCDGIDSCDAELIRSLDSCDGKNSCDALNNGWGDDLLYFVSWMCLMNLFTFVFNWFMRHCLMNETLCDEFAYVSHEFVSWISRIYNWIFDSWDKKISLDKSSHGFVSFMRHFIHVMFMIHEMEKGKNQLIHETHKIHETK